MRVLIAEDDPVIALALAERVRTLGHEPIGPAGDGEEAVALAREEAPDVYLFDIELPRLDGLEAEVDRAQQALVDRKLVERAKGLLMSALGLSEQDAFRRLQLTARERNLRLVDVAARIVEQQSLLAPRR
jgi:AmiR/NasT family two-component response regulator